MGPDLIRNKLEIIERCIGRVKEVYSATPLNLHDFTRQDSIMLNLQRAVEAAIDIAMFVVSKEKLGLPQNSNDAAQQGIYYIFSVG